jgi:hypothetical protein
MNPHQELSAATKGLKCISVTLYAPASWSFDFQGFGLNIQCPWRIVDERGIALGSEDDRQKFGLPAPVDGAAVAMQLIAGSPLKQVVITEKTGDIVLEFESGTRLEIFNNSSGYEGWNCGTPSGLNIVGMGGGGIANIASNQPST